MPITMELVTQEFDIAKYRAPVDFELLGKARRVWAGLAAQFRINDGKAKQSWANGKLHWRSRVVQLQPYSESG